VDALGYRQRSLKDISAETGTPVEADGLHFCLSR